MSDRRGGWPWAVLGLEGRPETAKDVRRAYAKQLKLLDVETQGSAFEELRAAYEFAKGNFEPGNRGPSQIVPPSRSFDFKRAEPAARPPAVEPEEPREPVERVHIQAVEEEAEEVAEEVAEEHVASAGLDLWGRVDEHEQYNRIRARMRQLMQSGDLSKTAWRPVLFSPHLDNPEIAAEMERELVDLFLEDQRRLGFGQLKYEFVDLVESRFGWFADGIGFLQRFPQAPVVHAAFSKVHRIRKPVKESPEGRNLPPVLFLTYWLVGVFVARIWVMPQLAFMVYILGWLASYFLKDALTVFAKVFLQKVGLRNWERRPLWGYKRINVLGAIALTLAVSAALVVDYSQMRLRNAYSEINLTYLNFQVKSNTENSLETFEELSWVDQKKFGSQDVFDPPIPRFTKAVKAPQFAESDEIAEEYRTVYCLQNEPAERPCFYEVRLPISHSIRAFPVDAPEVTYGQNLAKNIRVRFRHLNGVFAVQWDGDKADKPISNKSWAERVFVKSEDHILLRLAGLDREVSRGKNRWVTISRDVFDALVTDGLEIEMRSNIGGLAREIKQLCGLPREEGLATVDCETLKELELGYETGHCGQSAWDCGADGELPLSQIEHRFQYRFDTPDDWAFLELFRSVIDGTGLSADAAGQLGDVVEQIRSDYRLIMDSSSEDPEFSSLGLASVMARQPQVFPYYSDRENWSAEVMKSLESQLGALMP